MKIICTGSSGYIGSEVMFRLKLMGLKPIGVDIRDKLQKADVIIHLATDLSGSGIDYKMKEQALTETVCKMANKVVFTSSAAVYGNVKKPAKETDPLQPISDYGQAKVWCEEIIQKELKKYSIFRLANVYSKDATHGFISNLLAGGNILYDKGQRIRDYVHLSDVVKVLIEAALTDKWQGIYNIGTGKSLSAKQIYKRLTNRKPIFKDRIEIEESLFDVSKAKNNGFDPFTL